MPRLKRSQKQPGEVVKPAPAPAIAPLRAAERIVGALCPICGRVIPQDRAIKIGYVTVDRVGYFASIDWDENKPFGTSYPAGGRGSFRHWEPIGPDDAPELFEAVKARFIQAVREWMHKGWLSEEDILEG